MPAGPWDFKPEQASIDVHPGQVTTVMYSFHNRQNRAMAVQAIIPSYAPAVAMAHFTKLECFCFTQQVLQAGESKRWPVVFVLDSKLPRDVKTITLSYTSSRLAAGCRPSRSLPRACPPAAVMSRRAVPKANTAARSAKVAS